MNLAKNFASRREILSRFPSRSRFYFGRQGSCRDSRKCISARFWPPRSSFPARISTRFAVRSRRNFGRRDFCFPARIKARFAAASRRDFGRRDFCFPARTQQDRGEILAAGNFASWRESCRDPAGIPAERKNPGGQNLAAIPVGFPSRSCRDPAKIPVFILQRRGEQSSPSQ